MFDVLVFVYENYYSGDSYPEAALLKRKLNAVGFEPEEIGDAVNWLNGLNSVAQGLQVASELPPRNGQEPWLREPQQTSTRIYSTLEQTRLGTRGLGYLLFLESTGQLSAPMREVVVDRVVAAPCAMIDLMDLKTIVLMVFWSFGQEPEQLLLDELCDDGHYRLAN